MKTTISIYVSCRVPSHKKSPVPDIARYKLIRADRVAIVKGGVLAYVKRSLVAKEIGRVAADATEVLAFRIKYK